MTSGADTLSKTYINSLTVYIFIVWSSIFLLLIWNPGRELIAKILFAPFLLDISRGVGDTPALWFRGISLITFIILIVLVVIRIRSNKKSKQYLLSFAGIVATTIHYGLVALGYITTGLH